MTSDTPTSPSPTDPYHHGDLANTLRRAAADLLTERGPAGFSLREVARRAGVSHAAPAHHFGDARGLLTAVAIEGFEQLAEQTRRASEGVEDPVEALAEIGRAYVEVATHHPGHAAILFQKDAVDTDDPEYKRRGAEAYAVLVAAIESLARAQAPDLDVALAATLCWSTVQGLLTVHRPLCAMDGAADEAARDIGDLAAALTRLMVVGLVGRAAQPVPSTGQAPERR